MVILFMQLHVKPERRQDFLDMIPEIARLSEDEEPGCLRFDVLQDVRDENIFYYYDVYTDMQAAEAHRDTAHYKRYVAETAGMFSAPSVVSWVKPVYPTEANWR